MENGVTKEDLERFGASLIGTIRKLLDGSKAGDKEAPVDWLKSRMVRKMLDISAGTLQNLRVTGKIRYKKVLGSYYYNKEDLMHLFKDESNRNGN